MRKIILNLALSLDGFIEGPNGEFDWCLTDQDYGMTEFLNQTDAILFGRKSYELLMKYDSNPYPYKEKYIFSHNYQTDQPNTFVLTNDIEKKVRELKNKEGKNIWLYGGASLTSVFMKAGLVDEFMLSVHPILLGKGKPLFIDIQDRVHLKLTDTKTYSSGLVQLYYRIDKK